MVLAQWRSGLLAAFIGIALAACGAEDTAAPAGAQSPPPSGAPAGAPTQTPANSAPAITGVPGTVVAAESTYQFQPAATDADGDALTWSATGLPDWAAINPQSGMVYGTPTEADVGTTAEIVVAVSDGEASVSLPAFEITITSSAPPPPAPPPPPSGPPPANSAPVISGIPSVSTQATMAYSFTPSASDPDGQALTFSIANKPSWAAFSTSSGRLSGTPTTSQVRTYSNIVISVSDGALSTSLPAFALVVTAAPNRAPTVTGTPSISATAGQAYSFQPTGADPDGNRLTWSIANKPAWATFSTSSGRLSGTPGSNSVGTFPNVTISVSDGTLSASLAAFTITVGAATNAAPTISGSPATSAVAGGNYSFTPTASDPEGKTLSFSISGKPSWASFNVATGALTGTAQAGTFANIVITASDGTNTKSLAAFTINVTQVSAPATGTAALSWSAPTQNTDGSALTDLAGYRVYHGTSASALNEVIQVPGSGNTVYTFNQLASGTHYFAVAAYNTAGVESALSGVGSKTIQ